MKFDELPLKKKIGQMFMTGFKGEKLPVALKNCINNYNIGFCILFARNIKSLPQVISLTNHLHSLASISPFIFTDQEGGTVVQFKELTLPLTSHMGLAATNNSHNAKIAGSIIGEEMNTLGIDGVLGPVLDVNREINNPVIGIRSFSDNPKTVAEYGTNFYAGLKNHKIIACGKHFPGHGDTIQDSHAEIPLVLSSRQNLEKINLVPFKHLIQRDIPALLTAHIRFAKVSEDIATFSPRIIGQILRKQLGFRGVLFSDCLEMKAVKDYYSPETIINKGIEAGLDVFTVSHSFDFLEELLAILHHKVKNKKVTEERIDKSYYRILQLKQMFVDLQDRKVRKPDPLKVKSAKNLILQEKIVDQSITLLKNRQSLIPISNLKKVLIIEWEKVKATLPVTQAEPVSMLEKIAGEYLPNSQFCLLKLNYGITKTLQNRLSGFDYVIAGVYSRSPKIEKLQAAALRRILEMRPDLIVVALGNPFDLRHFPRVKTYIATFGFRNIQIRALFKMVTGIIKPVGKLPIELKLK